jgi:manganese transport protein
VGVEEASSLRGAYRLLEPVLGRMSSVLFAVALLCSGQSSTFTGTMAGQVVMEGFLHWKITPWVRRILTRCTAIVPAALTAALAGEAGLDFLLVISQVTLSFQLPFAIIPLVLFATSERRLGPYAVGWRVACLGWGVCTLVIVLNLYMLGTLLSPSAERR